MQKQEVSRIYKTTDYSKFIVNAAYYNSTRINFLLYKQVTRNAKLPLVVVRKIEDKLEIVAEQDAFYVAQQLGLPVYYYEAFQSLPHVKQQIDFSFEGMQELLDFCLDNGNFGGGYEKEN